VCYSIERDINITDLYLPFFKKRDDSGGSEEGSDISCTPI